MGHLDLLKLRQNNLKLIPESLDFPYSSSNASLFSFIFKLNCIFHKLKDLIAKFVNKVVDDNLFPDIISSSVTDLEDSNNH